MKPDSITEYPHDTRSCDAIVIGAGVVGTAIAYGLVRQGLRVLVLDGTDGDLRAAKANFGLVWVQGKGFRQPAYQQLSRRSAALWPAFARELTAETGIELDYRAEGGIHFCVGQTQWEQRAEKLSRLADQLPGHESCTEMLDRAQLQRLFPKVQFGPEVSGASYGRMDGHVNPLRLLAALQRGFQVRGGNLRTNSPVSRIAPLPGGGFSVDVGTQRFEAARVVVAAGLGSSALGPMVGLDVPLRPQRGQLLVTERLAPILPLPASGLRQTAEGTVMIGVTQEEVGYDLSTTTAAAARMSRQASRVLPALRQAQLVRHWSCLRVMTPDGCPVYAESADHPGAWIALCHSGITLAAFHAGPLAAAFAQARIPDELQIFHHGRFNVPQTA
jgi:glycine/D-amino acid oxidase-like deaminating enzyme